MSKPDENEEAARIVRDSTASDDALPESLEAAWEVWSAGIQQVDERTLTLLRAAFEAGVDAAGNPAVQLGQLGGKKGGPARAKALSKERRSGIAKKAARARWDREEDRGS